MQIDPSHESHELTPARKQKTYLTPSLLARETNPGAVQAQRPGFLYLCQQIERLR